MKLALIFLSAFTATAATVATATAATTTLSPAERALADFVEADFVRASTLLETTVAINSGTMNFDGVREVGALFRRELDELGFETRWVDGAGFDRAGHLVARRPAAAANATAVLMIGHLDTVFEPDSPFQHYQELTGKRAKGPGTTDMKGGNVVLLTALQALDSVGALDSLDLRVVLTGDEEAAGRPLELSRKALRDAATGADYALGFEDGDGNPATAVIARRGSTNWQLRVTGVPAHSSQIFQPGIGAGAIYEASRILLGFYERLSAEHNLTFNPGLILGGTEVDFDSAQARGSAFGKNNVVAEHAVVSGDLRASSPQQYDRAKKAMRQVVSESLPETRAELEFSEGYPPMAPTDGNRSLLGLYDLASRDLGLGPVAAVDPRNAGAADVSFVAGIVPQVLDGLGLMGTGGHTVEETADLETLTTQAQRAAVLLYRLRLRAAAAR